MGAAILFPGQGAQHPGMGKDWAEAEPAARAVFERADAALGFPLSEACWGDGEDIHRTDLAQPGIFTTSVAVIEVLRERGEDLSAAPFAAGLSLGEYTALWCAGAFDFEDGLRLVRLRGEAMQEASEACPSGMTSLLGADEATARELAEIGAAEGICAVANLNSPGQVVVSGEIAALEAVERAAPDRGIKRAVRLSVAGGFHSECMRPAAERLRVALDETQVRPLRIPVVSNVTARPVEGPEHVRDLLARQVCEPVLWERSMRWALDQGHESFLEPAPGTVLAALLKRIGRETDRRPTVRSVEHPGDLA